MACRKQRSWGLRLALVGAAGAALSAAMAVPALAASQDFETVTGAKNPSSNQPVDATAIFTTSANTISVQITNNIVNPNDVSQNVSDLFFTVNGVTAAATLSSSSANYLNVNDNGTTSTPNPSSGSTGWSLTSNDSSTIGGLTGYHLNDLGAAGPQHTILGKPDSNGVYSNANGSIAGNNAHNPFLVGDVLFTLNFAPSAGITSETTIDQVFFSFGTTAGVNVQGYPGGIPPSSVPEPIFYQMGGLLGLGGIGLLRMRGRRAVSP